MSRSTRKLSVPCALQALTRAQDFSGKVPAHLPGCITAVMATLQNPLQLTQAPGGHGTQVLYISGFDRFVHFAAQLFGKMNQHLLVNQKSF